MAKSGLSIEDAAVRSFLGGLNAEMAKGSTETFRAWGISTRDSFIADRLSGNPLVSRSGAFRKSMQVENTNKPLTTEVYSDAPYARIQDLGGTITPKRAKWLTIPTRSQLTGSGRRRWESLTELPNVFFRRVASTGRLYAYQRRADGTTTKVATLLKKVTIKPGNLTVNFAPQKFAELAESMDLKLVSILR